MRLANESNPLRGSMLPRVYETSVPAYAFVAAAAAWAGVTISPDDWRAEKRRMLEAGSLAAYIRTKRTGARFRVDRCARAWLWDVAHTLRETPNPGTACDFQRYAEGAEYVTPHG